mgnify:CR=1 FL=1
MFISGIVILEMVILALEKGRLIYHRFIPLRLATKQNLHVAQVGIMKLEAKWHSYSFSFSSLFAKVITSPTM